MYKFCALLLLVVLLSSCDSNRCDSYSGERARPFSKVDNRSRTTSSGCGSSGACVSYETYTRPSCKTGPCPVATIIEPKTETKPAPKSDKVVSFPSPTK
jgi:hypothetical protein